MTIHALVTAIAVIAGAVVGATAALALRRDDSQECYHRGYTAGYRNGYHLGTRWAHLDQDMRQ